MSNVERNDRYSIRLQVVDRTMLCSSFSTHKEIPWKNRATLRAEGKIWVHGSRSKNPHNTLVQRRQYNATIKIFTTYDSSVKITAAGGTGRKGEGRRKKGRKKKKKRRRPGSPVEGLLVLFDLAAGQLVKLRVNVDEFVLLFHLLPFLELLVDPLPPAKQITELSVRRHPDRFHFHSSNSQSSDIDLAIYRSCACRSIRRVHTMEV